MTVTFQSGQFFHPIYGWFDKEPDFKVSNNRSGMISEPIGEDIAISLDDLPVQFAESLKELIARLNDRSQRYAELLEAGLIDPPKNTDPPANTDLSYYMDTRTVGAGYYIFEYKGNSVTAKVNETFSIYDTDKLNKQYETHMQNIMDLKKVGYNDEAIKMLLAALDEEYRKAQNTIYKYWSQFSNMKFASEELAIKFFNGLLEMNAWAEANEPSKVAFSAEDIERIRNSAKDPNSWLPDDYHIRDLDKIRDFSWDDSMSDIEKEARSLSIVFRVRGDQMVDYARRYEEISGQLDDKLSNGEISDSDYDRYVSDLNTAFIKTYNLNITGQAMAAGLSEEKAVELARSFSEEYIKIRAQTDPGERDADKMANAALQNIAAQGWPAFSLYSSDNRATVAADDPWYAMMSEDVLYWWKVQPYPNW